MLNPERNLWRLFARLALVPLLMAAVASSSQTASAANRNGLVFPSGTVLHSSSPATESAARGLASNAIAPRHGARLQKTIERRQQLQTLCGIVIDARLRRIQNQWNHPFANAIKWRV
jgi:hypothetical protein